jgi:hypothetical protein
MTGNKRLHTPVTIADISEIQLGMHSVCKHLQLNSVCVNVTLDGEASCLPSWTVPVSSQMFAAAQDTQPSQSWGVPGVPSVKKKRLFTQIVQKIIFQVLQLLLIKGL